MALNIIDDEAVACASACAVLIYGSLILEEKGKKKKRSCWVSPWLRSRETSRFFVEPEGYYENLCRLSAEDFELLLQKVGPMIHKQDTAMRRAIPASDRLAVSLRFLSTADSYKSLSRTFKISVAAISECVRDTLNGLNNVLSDQIQMPQSLDDWKQTAEEFEKKWGFPHCVGAISGRHILLNPAPQYETLDHNSFIVIAGADANHFFTHMEIIDSADLRDNINSSKTDLYTDVKNKKIILPEDEILPSVKQPMPYVFAVSDAFRLGRHFMRPYPSKRLKPGNKQTFNKRLSYALLAVENALGVMSSVFHVLTKPLVFTKQKVLLNTKTAFLLHNYIIRTKSAAAYAPPEMYDRLENGELFPGRWRNQVKENGASFVPLRSLQRSSTFGTSEEKAIRDAFVEHFEKINQNVDMEIDE